MQTKHTCTKGEPKKVKLKAPSEIANCRKAISQFRRCRRNRPFSVDFYFAD